MQKICLVFRGKGSRGVNYNIRTIDVVNNEIHTPIDIQIAFY